MQRECYLYHLSASKVLTLSRSENSMRWNLRIDGEIVGPDYSDPLQAALDANKADFEDEQLISIFKKVKVPSDLWSWQPCHTNRKVVITRD